MEELAPTDTMTIGPIGSRSAYYFDNICLSSDSLYNETWIGLIENNIFKFNIIIQPNPSNDKITITFPTHSNTSKLELINAIGKRLRSMNISSSQDKIEIFREKLPAGLYLISFTDEGKKSTKRIIFE